MKSDCIHLSVNEVTFEGCVLEGQRVGGKSGRQRLCIYYQDNLEEAGLVQALPFTSCDAGPQFPNP